MYEEAGEPQSFLDLVRGQLGRTWVSVPGSGGLQRPGRTGLIWWLAGSWAQFLSGGGVWSFRGLFQGQRQVKGQQRARIRLVSGVLAVLPRVRCGEAGWIRTVGGLSSLIKNQFLHYFCRMCFQHLADFKECI